MWWRCCLWGLLGGVAGTFLGYAQEGYYRYSEWLLTPIFFDRFQNLAPVWWFAFGYAIAFLIAFLLYNRRVK